MRPNKLELGRRQQRQQKRRSSDSLCFPAHSHCHLPPFTSHSHSRLVAQLCTPPSQPSPEGQVRQGRRSRVRSHQHLIHDVDVQQDMGSAAEVPASIILPVSSLLNGADDESHPVTPKIHNTRPRRNTNVTPGSVKRVYEESDSDSDLDPEQSLELDKSNSTGASTVKDNLNLSESEDDGSLEAKAVRNATQVSLLAWEESGTNCELKHMEQKDVLRIKASRGSPRQLNIQEIKVSSDPEEFFLAAARIKYKGDDVEAAATKGPKKPRKGNRTGRTKDSNLPERSISNFSVSKALAKISNPPHVPEKHFDEVSDLQQEIVKDFPPWIYMLREGFNVMLYGYGSKMPIFKEFKDFLKDEFLVLPVNGLFPKMNGRKFLVGFWDGLNIDEKMPKNSSVSGLADDLYHVLCDIDHPNVFILVSNGEMLASKHPQCFEALCSIVRIPFVHLIASCDHINSFLGVDQAKLVQLNMIWVDCTTFSLYDHELTWKLGAFGVDGKESSSKSTLEHVLKSLTANARQAFKILADLQLKAMRLAGKTKSRDFAGIEFRELARRCQEGFIAHSYMGLRTLLTEFVDHKLVRYAGKNKKEDVLVVDLEIETLESLADTA